MATNPELLLHVQQEQRDLNKVLHLLLDAQSAICADPPYPVVARDRIIDSMQMIINRLANNASPNQ